MAYYGPPRDPTEVMGRRIFAFIIDTVIVGAVIVDLFCFGVVGLVTSLVTHPHRRVGDMVGGTFVVGTADAGRPVQASYAAQPAYAGAVPGGWGPPQEGQPQWGAPPQPQWGAP